MAMAHPFRRRWTDREADDIIFDIIQWADMAQLLIRKLDNSVVRRLKELAALRGHSLEQEARDILAAAAKLTPEERKASAERIRARTRWIPSPDSTELIRAERDRR